MCRAISLRRLLLLLLQLCKFSDLGTSGRWGKEEGQRGNPQRMGHRETAVNI